MTLPFFALGCQGRALALYPHLKTFFGWSKDLASWLFPPLPLLKCCWAPMAIEIKPFWLGRPQHYITTSVSPPFSSVVVGPLLQRSGFLGLANDQGTSAHTQNRAKWREREQIWCGTRGSFFHNGLQGLDFLAPHPQNAALLIFSPISLLCWLCKHFFILK